MSTELAVVDAEIISVEWNVTPLMVQEVTGYILRTVTEQASSGRVRIETKDIARYFGVETGLINAVSRVIMATPRRYLGNAVGNINVS